MGSNRPISGRNCLTRFKEELERNIGGIPLTDITLRVLEYSNNF